LISKYFL